MPAIRVPTNTDAAPAASPEGREWVPVLAADAASLIAGDVLRINAAHQIQYGAWSEGNLVFVSSMNGDTIRAQHARLGMGSFYLHVLDRLVPALPPAVEPGAPVTIHSVLSGRKQVPQLDLETQFDQAFTRMVTHVISARQQEIADAPQSVCHWLAVLFMLWNDGNTLNSNMEEARAIEAAARAIQGLLRRVVETSDEAGQRVIKTFNGLRAVPRP